MPLLSYSAHAMGLVVELQSLLTSQEFNGDAEGNMKFQNRIRMQMMTVGLGALLLAGSARAQQDMDPTYFEIKPGTPAVSQAVVRQAAQSPAALKENSTAQSAMTFASSDDVTLEADVTRMEIADVGVALILFAGMVSIVSYAILATRRERAFKVSAASALRVSQASAPYTPVSAATAQ